MIRLCGEKELFCETRNEAQDLTNVGHLIIVRRYYMIVRSFRVKKVSLVAGNHDREIHHPRHLQTAS